MSTPVINDISGEDTFREAYLRGFEEVNREILEFPFVESDGEPLDTPWHRDCINLLIESTLQNFHDRDDFYVGGELMYVYNVELKYKLNDILRLYFFQDGGSVWSEPSDVNFGDMRYSVGIGVGFDVPLMGPIRVDYGFPLNPDGSQGSGRMHLQAGFNF